MQSFHVKFVRVVPKTIRSVFSLITNFLKKGIISLNLGLVGRANLVEFHLN